MIPMALLLAAFLGIAIFLLSWFFAICKRLRLVLLLRRACRKNHGTVKWNWFPLFSLFFVKNGFDFELKTPTLSYCVSLLSTRHRFREHSFASPTEMYVYRKIRLFGVAGGRVRYRMNEFNFGVSIRHLPIDLTEEGPEGAEKVLLFYPVPRDVTMIHGTKKITVGNGDELYNGYRLLTLSAFLDEVDRGVVYKRKKKSWELE